MQPIFQVTGSFYIDIFFPFGYIEVIYKIIKKHPNIAGYKNTLSFSKMRRALNVAINEEYFPNGSFPVLIQLLRRTRVTLKFVTYLVSIRSCPLVRTQLWTKTRLHNTNFVSVKHSTFSSIPNHDYLDTSGNRVISNQRQCITRAATSIRR